MNETPDLAATLAEVLRADRGRLVAALVARLRDFQLAEDCLQEASEAALVHWGRSGLPRRPVGWLLRVAQRKALDRLRRDANFARKSAEIAVLQAEDETLPDEPEIPDKRLALIFTCCHPALDAKSRVALTLRTLGGLSTAEIARAFLDKEATMGQRLSRAKSKISAARIPFVVPNSEDWPERVSSVLTVIYLIFNEGYSATAGDDHLRVALCEEAIWLARMVDKLRPNSAEVLGLLSLMLTTHARRDARTSAKGELVPLDEQDRSVWDQTLMAEGLRHLDEALVLSNSGPYQIKAAISALHGQATRYKDTDWRQMLLLYNSLIVHEPSPVVHLNRTVVLAELSGPAAALLQLDAMATDLENYQPFHATQAALFARLGDVESAHKAYETAISLSQNTTEREFLRQKQARLPSQPSPN